MNLTTATAKVITQMEMIRMRLAVLPMILIAGLTGCATTGDTIAKGQPRFSYESAKSPETLARCLVSKTADTHFLGLRVNPPTVIDESEGRRLHWFGNDNVFAKLVPAGEGSHLDFYFDTMIGVAQRGTIEGVVRACQ